MTQVLREFVRIDYSKDVIKESIEQKKPIILNGVLQRANAKNHNGRIYPRSVLEREINNYSKVVREGRAVGEADHPDLSVISLKNVSHVIREINWNGDDVVGKVEILNTPSGKILQNLMEAGITLGISSRGVGDVSRDDEGNDIVGENFLLLCFDMVSEPSTHGAFLRESKNVDMKEVMDNLSKKDKVNRLANEILRS